MAPVGRHAALARKTAEVPSSRRANRCRACPPGVRSRQGRAAARAILRPRRRAKPATVPTSHRTLGASFPERVVPVADALARAQLFRRGRVCPTAALKQAHPTTGARELECERDARGTRTDHADICLKHISLPQCTPVDHHLSVSSAEASVDRAHALTTEEEVGSVVLGMCV